MLQQRDAPGEREKRKGRKREPKKAYVKRSGRVIERLYGALHEDVVREETLKNERGIEIVSLTRPLSLSTTKENAVYVSQTAQCVGVKMRAFQARHG